MKILHIVGSPRGERSLTKKLGEFAANVPGGEVVTVDVHAEKVPFHTGAAVALNYGYGDYESLDADSKAAIDAQKKYVEQLRSADVLVVSAPMWNFGPPAALKAWIDLITKVNDTFSMDENGYHGHLSNIKKAVVVTSAGGGSYDTAPMDSYDHLNGYLVGLLAFVGITNTKLVRVEQVNAAPDSVPAKIAEAEKAVSEFLSA